MDSQYHMELSQFSLQQLRHIVESGDLLPSEQILREEVHQRFAILESMGIRSLKDLMGALSTKRKLERFALESGLPPKYLTILRRRTGLYTPRPAPLKKLPRIAPQYVERLAMVGVKDTRQLFERGKTAQDRAALATEAGVPERVVLELVKLSDLVRAPFVGPVYARWFYEAGADTLEKLAASQAGDLCERMRQVNEDQELTRVQVPAADEMASFLEFIQRIPLAIEY